MGLREIIACGILFIAGCAPIVRAQYKMVSCSVAQGNEIYYIDYDENGKRIDSYTHYSGGPNGMAVSMEDIDADGIVDKIAPSVKYKTSKGYSFFFDWGAYPVEKFNNLTRETREKAKNFWKKHDNIFKRLEQANPYQ